MSGAFLKPVAALFLGLGAMLSAGAQTAPFYPNDPYFNPDVAELPSGYTGQWHLYNQMPVQEGGNAGVDINILGAWQMGYTGKGVIIGVLDDGVDSLHPDLAASFYNEYSWDFGLNRAQNLASANRGSPLTTAHSHGTAVAGIAAAIGGNGIGVSGVAPGAGIASSAILTRDHIGEEFYQIEARAVLFQGQVGADGQPDPNAAPDWSLGVPMRVKNHSYTTLGSYYDISDELRQAYTESMAQGVIHVFGAGNNRTPDSAEKWVECMDTGKLDRLNVPGIITVVALAADGKFASYSNYGSNVFVTAPGGDGIPDGFKMTTTDRSGAAGYNYETDGQRDRYFNPENPGSGEHVLDYMSSFTGTSGAAPVVAGVMALGVEANPDLNARTAQHILARTSRIVDPNDSTREGGWVRNGAGFSFNRNYGFGLIDATAFVQMAARRGYATKQTIHVSETMDVEESFSEMQDVISYAYYADIPFELLQPIEYIAVQIVVSGLQPDIAAYGTGTGDGVGTIMGDLEAWLTSPNGTRQMLFMDDRALVDGYSAQRSHGLDVLEWGFLSYAYWGENPVGEWILELVNNTGNTPTGTWDKVTFAIGMGDYVIPEPQTVALVLGFASLLVVAMRRRQRAV